MLRDWFKKGGNEIVDINTFTIKINTYEEIKLCLGETWEEDHE